MKRLWRRILTAAKVLFLPGDHTPVTRADLHALRQEHNEWVMTLTDILEKLNAWYARQAKREKRALEAGLMEGPQQPAAVASEPGNHKLHLYRKVAAASGGGRHTPEEAP